MTEFLSPQAHTLHTRVAFVIPEAFKVEPMASAIANLCQSSFRTQGKDALTVAVAHSPHTEVHFTVMGSCDDERLQVLARAVGDHIRALLPLV